MHDLMTNAERRLKRERDGRSTRRRVEPALGDLSKMNRPPEAVFVWVPVRRSPWTPLLSNLLMMAVGLAGLALLGLLMLVW